MVGTRDEERRPRTLKSDPRAAVRVRAGKEAGGGTQSRATKADINFGSQIRSYVLAPYRLIKDHRTKLGVGDVDRVLDGDLDELMHAWLVYRHTGKLAGDGKEEIPIESADQSGARADPAAAALDPGGEAGGVPHGNGVRTGRGPP